MALTSDQILSLYEALEVPSSTQVNYLSEDLLHSVSYDVAQQAQVSAKLQIDAYLANPSEMTPAKEARLSKYLSDWDEISTVTFGMQAGNTGNIGGVTIDYAQQRAIIQDRICNLVPFRREHERLAAQMQNSSVVWLTR